MATPAFRSAVEAVRGQPVLRDEELVLPYPLPAHARCPIAGCRTQYSGTGSVQQRASLCRHLARSHDLRPRRTTWRSPYARLSPAVPEPAWDLELSPLTPPPPPGLLRFDRPWEDTPLAALDPTPAPRSSPSSARSAWVSPAPATLPALLSPALEEFLEELEPEEASRLQRLYRANRDRAVRRILAEESPRCEVAFADLAAHFAPDEVPLFSWDERPSCVPDLPPAPEHPHLTAPITHGEVELRLRRAANTAPGDDGLRYAAWRALDPGCLLLREAFELCRRACRVPEAWKASQTVLLHKGGDPTLATSWRPIALARTVAKLYAGVWADRLAAWAEAGDVMSAQQKAFRSFDGVLEHNFVLQCAVNDARRAGGECHIVFVDLTNAFGSVPHALLWEALERFGLSPEALRAVRDLYEGSCTQYRLAAELSDPVQTRCGVRQGCPLSGLLFNIAMEPVLRALRQSDVRCPAYADDLALIVPSAAAVAPALRVLEAVCGWCSLEPNPRKSGLLSVGAAPPAVTLSGAPLPVVERACSYRYLGRPVGHTRLSEPPLDVLAATRRDAFRLLDSALAPWQKLDAMRTFIVPRLTHCLRLGVLPKTPLRVFDKALRWRVKGVLGVPLSATNGYLYAPSSTGGVGLTELGSEADVLLLAASVQLLRSRDPLVAELAAAELTRVVRRRVGRPPTPADMTAYLNGERMRDGGDVSSRFSRARVATRALASSVPVAWHAAHPVPELRVGPTAVEARGESKALRNALRMRALSDLVAKPHQGRVMECVASQPVSSHYMYNGSFTRFAEWRFVHRARLGLVPLNGYRRGAGDRRCRRCGYAKETLPHVLNHCRPHSAALQRRHNAILARLERAVPRFAGTDVRVNRRVPGTESALRPDLVVTRGAHVSLVDVTVSFENRLAALRAAGDEKVAKYAGLVAELRRQGKHASVHALVIGSLGTWYRGNEETLRHLRVSRVYARLMRKLMVSDTLRWSRDVYVEHVTGVRQYE
ncbi:uncharacterized protein LOC119089394 [Pollicipes pollicipes]|uniref:uncharacterized protein LOC119089394 n=1 Tax=Pollicipes pollicipes TaxID=41117 RepID=UPI0018849371|nr:uncharacterized protein LOC119089394 [Pollicipes pollicipes]